MYTIHKPSAGSSPEWIRGERQQPDILKRSLNAAFDYRLFPPLVEYIQEEPLVQGRYSCNAGIRIFGSHLDRHTDYLGVLARYFGVSHLDNGGVGVHGTGSHPGRGTMFVVWCNMREQMKINVKLTDGAPLPEHAKPGDAGLDLTTRETVTLEPGETRIVGTGVSVEIPEGHVGLVFPRSGLGSRGINLSNCVGVIDSGYRGEIKAPLHNNHSYMHRRYGRIMASHDTMTVKRGERVCQLIVVPFVTCECVEVDELSDTERGADGFGSTDG